MGRANRTRSGKSTAGKREDLGGLYVRSAWEANYARYLNWLLSLDKIGGWEYEPDEFEFYKIKRGNRFYRPDFKVRENDGSIIYHEVKGWWDRASITKVSRMRKYYPGIRLVIIGATEYREIRRKVGRLVPGWESVSFSER